MDVHEHEPDDEPDYDSHHNLPQDVGLWLRDWLFRCLIGSFDRF
jgi:hypothetical protein